MQCMVLGSGLGYISDSCRCLFKNPGLCELPPVRPGREVTTSPLGLETKSLKNGTIPCWGLRRNLWGPHKQNKTKLLKKKLVQTPKQSWAKKFQGLNTDEYDSETEN